MIKKVTSHINQNEGLIFERSREGKIGYSLSALDVPAVKPEELVDPPIFWLSRIRIGDPDGHKMLEGVARWATPRSIFSRENSNSVEKSVAGALRLCGSPRVWITKDGGFLETRSAPVLIDPVLKESVSCREALQLGHVKSPSSSNVQFGVVMFFDCIRHFILMRGLPCRTELAPCQVRSSATTAT